MKILDLGCGDRKFQTNNPNDIVVGLDINKNSDADVIHNLNDFPYPFEDNEFDLIHSSHVLEHLDHPKEFFKEIHRILKKNGKFILKVPHFSSATAVSFLHHKHYFNVSSFDDPFFTKYFKIINMRLNYCAYRNKWYKRLLNGFFSFFANLNQQFCERFWCYWIGGFSEIEVTFVKI